MGNLKKYSDIPRHLQFNPYILSGYRPQLDVRGCLRSLLYLHNESGNIHTHIIAVVSSLLYIFKYAQLWPRESSWTVVSFFLIVDCLVSSLTFGLSIIYHTFMCHHGGKKVYNRLLTLDVLGVWLFVTSATFPVIYTTFHCYPQLRLWIMVIYLGASLLGLSRIVGAGSRLHRAFGFFIQYALRLFVLACRLSPLATGVPDNTFYYLLLETLSTFSVVVNTLHIPERWMLGRFDYFFNGHTLMHVGSTAALLVFKTGFIIDMEWINNGEGAQLCNLE